MLRWTLVGLLLFTRAGTLSAQPITQANFDLAAKYSRAHGGLALRVEQDGKVFENYAGGFSSITAHRIYSGTKNFVAVTALIAEQDGLLKLSEPASNSLPEWRHDRRRTITLDELLSQTSGLTPGSDIIDPARDQMMAALKVPLIDPPGTRFHYGPVGYQAFGEVLKRKLRPSGRSVEGYMTDRLFRPLHIHIPYWKHDDAGNPLMHAGLWLTTEEWARFGEFVKDEANGIKKQLVEPQLFNILFTGHSANPAYGLAFWLNRPQHEPLVQRLKYLLPAMDGSQLYPGGPRDIYAAEGTDKQRLYVIPSHDLVIVRFSMESRYSDADFLSRLLTGRPHPDLHSH